MNHDFATEVAKAAPPLAVSGLSFSGVALSDWVYILTLIYLAFQILVIVRDKVIVRRKRKAADLENSETHDQDT